MQSHIRHKGQNIIGKRSGKQMPVLNNLRPATPDDVTKGTVFWFPHWERCKWVVVHEALSPNDEYKAFVGDDGFMYGKYGLERAFVEVADVDKAKVLRLEKALRTLADETPLDPSATEGIAREALL